IGGGGVINLDLLKDFVFCAVVGRCDFPISELIEGCKRAGVIYFDKWQGEQVNISHPETLYEPHEKTAGCQRKCFYCEYGWKYKFLGVGDKYNSGLAHEDFLPHLEIKEGVGRYASGLDGLTEKERFCVNKKITNAQFIE